MSISIFYSYPAIAQKEKITVTDDDFNDYWTGDDGDAFDVCVEHWNITASIIY